jgi:hypothetical protein
MLSAHEDELEAAAEQEDQQEIKRRVPCYLHTALVVHRPVTYVHLFLGMHELGDHIAPGV